MVIAYLPLLICILGLLIWKLAGEPWQRPGEHMFWTGLLVTLFSAASKTVNLF